MNAWIRERACEAAQEGMPWTDVDARAVVDLTQRLDEALAAIAEAERRLDVESVPSFTADGERRPLGVTERVSLLVMRQAQTRLPNAKRVVGLLDDLGATVEQLKGQWRALAEATEEG